jgi:hypothetical protein
MVVLLLAENLLCAPVILKDWAPDIVVEMVVLLSVGLQLWLLLLERGVRLVSGAA